PTESRKGGHLRTCTNPDCRRPSFPRTDPAVIVLVEHPDGDGGPPRCLLGRSSHFLPGMYSTLAGFVEPGESMEQTVRREVFEESGIEVGEVRYLASQPWPFPSSLMIGFHATAISSDIRLHDQELEDARWFSADELLAMKARGEDETFCLPRKDSIARFLIETWLQDKQSFPKARRPGGE
ncbi:MAG: NAD(+) diphosphatase, partial [Xanthomonadaceae bacterium]|nr:NAD(+) diphosphatase [Xanthomonadaceae bacterium]